MPNFWSFLATPLREMEIMCSWFFFHKKLNSDPFLLENLFISSILRAAFSSENLLVKSVLENGNRVLELPHEIVINFCLKLFSIWSTVSAILYFQNHLLSYLNTLIELHLCGQIRVWQIMMLQYCVTGCVSIWPTWSGCLLILPG